MRAPPRCCANSTGVAIPRAIDKECIRFRHTDAGVATVEPGAASFSSRGKSNKVIAHELFLRENTIETHLRRIY
jgi:hypothetical protein